MPYVAAIAAVASAVVGAAGAIKQGQAQSDASNYQAQVARNNAITAQQNATLATQQADAKAQADNRATAIKIGAQRAALAANGVDIDSGSAAGIQMNTAASGALGAAQDVYQGKLQAYGNDTQAGNFTAQAGLDAMGADNASAAGGIGAASSILKGASTFAAKWPVNGSNPGFTGGTGTSIEPGNYY